MGEHDGCFCSFVLARVVSSTACPSHSHHEFPDWCPQASGSERVKCPERGADGRTAEQQCWDCNSPYLPAARPSPVPPGTPLQLLPSSTPSSCPQALQPGPASPSRCQNSPLSPAGEGPALPSAAARSKSCLDGSYNLLHVIPFPIPWAL